MEDYDEDLINMTQPKLELVSEGIEEIQVYRTCESLSNSSNQNNATSSPWKSTTNGIKGQNQSPSPWYDAYATCDSDNDVPLIQCDGNSFNQLPLDEDHCHVQTALASTNNTARNQLLISSVLCLAFMVAEIVGGYLSGSLAIMADAAHMLSDLMSFLISLFAIWVGKKPPSRKMPFGYYRAEILGALTSVILIWILSGILIYMAINRVINQTNEIKANIMIITAVVGILFNIIMGSVLHTCCHCPHGSSLVGHTHSSHSHKSNINVRAAFIHVIGDLLQSIGVLVTALIINFRPEYHLADLICTFFFSALVLLTTIGILKAVIRVLMEGFPSEINYKNVTSDLESIEGVECVKSLHMWSLTVGKHVLIAHLILGMV
uniref:Cation efflux protein transmembrane domain-containing protein n=1 Tax=Strigamia maritima TaxID=126957 RepID=T1IRQ1_STRMM